MEHYKVIEIDEFGSSDVLKSKTHQLRSTFNDEVCIKVTHCGVAFIDILMRMGAYPKLPSLPFILGQDVVGHVYAKGSDVDALEVGQRVIAHTNVGGYAEYLFASQHNVIAINEQLEGAELVSLPLNYVIAYQMLHRVSKVKPNSNILIHAGAGGVGTALLDLAKNLNITAYVTVSSSKKYVVVDKGGIAIDYRNSDFVDYINECCPMGMDVVFDPIGGNHWQKSSQVIRKGGILVGYGFQSLISGENASKKVELSALMAELNQLSRFGINPEWYSISSLKNSKPEWYREDLAELIALLKKGLIQPKVHSVLPLSEAKSAHDSIETGNVIGKVVLQP